MTLTATLKTKSKQLSPMNQLRRRLWLPAILSTLILTSQTAALAEGRVLQVLGVCGQADAQYIGNRKHGRSQLVSFGPTGFAGFFLEGLEGLKMSELNSTFLLFAPPPDGTSTFELRIKTNNPKVQLFTIGPDTDPALPNFPTRDSADGLKLVNIQGAELIGGKSKLNEDDTIVKFSFLFSCKKKNSRQELFVDDVGYNAKIVSIVLDPITCNLK